VGCSFCEYIAPVIDDVRIPCHGEQIAAYVYRPDTNQGDAPCVVMAHGFTGTREDGLPGYAEAFCDAGFVVVVFDYRHFGDSTGEPRQLLDIARQLEDYRTVVTWARGLDGVDPDRIVLWGSSYSGGHVLTLAAEDERIAAVIAQGPYTDSIAAAKCVGARNVAHFAVEGLRDQLGAWLCRPPRLVKAVGAPGDFAVITAPHNQSDFAPLVGPNSKWRNEFAARLMLTFPFYQPGRKAKHIKMPLLVTVCEQDTITPAAPAIKAAEQAPRAELSRYPYRHFQIYSDPQVKADQVAFLQRTVLGVC
jgi:pimeloyl-ACP methyl ester carboxylesterase